MNCPVCSNNAKRVFSKYGYWVLECKTCTHQFAEYLPDNKHVKVVYDDSYFTGGEAGYTDYLSEGKIIKKQGNFYAEILSKYIKPGKLLDVGSAAGFIMQGFRDNGWHCKGIEPNYKMADYARMNGFDVDAVSFEEYKSDQQYDVITMIQVIAHFINLKEAFNIASQCLKDDGYLLIETWNKNSLTAKILKKNWHEYSPPSVLFWFSPDSLNKLLFDFGFEFVAKGKPNKKISGEHAKSLLSYKFADMKGRKIFNKILNFIPDNISAPYPFDDIFWVLYKKRK